MEVLTNIAQLATCPPGRGPGDIETVDNASLAHDGGEIAWVGPQEALPSIYAEWPQRDCGGGLLIPGLVDCHTHLCFGGWRADEFAARLAGASYEALTRAGGGILSTVQATREAAAGELLDKAHGHLDAMQRLGVTTVEAKSGYGLDAATELKQLRVYASLRERHSTRLVPTFLGAHLIPPEYKDNRDGYVELLCDELLPIVAGEQLAEFCDCFVERTAFTPHEAERILTRARELGLGVKIHAEQLSRSGGASLAARLGAISAEHLEHVDDTDLKALAASGTVAVSLPLASLYLRGEYLDACRFHDHAIPVAVASDFNPGTAPSYDLTLALLLACLNQGMAPAMALQGATTHAAAALGRKDRLGSLQPGYRADFALMDTPSVNHWIYHHQPNACAATAIDGEWVYER